MRPAKFAIDAAAQPDQHSALYSRSITRRLLLLIALVSLLLQAGCGCAPLGDRTLPSGEDKYSAQYD